MKFAEFSVCAYVISRDSHCSSSLQFKLPSEVLNKQQGQNSGDRLKRLLRCESQTVQSEGVCSAFNNGGRY